MSTKIESAIFKLDEQSKDEIIFYGSLDTDLYEEKYKGKLTCINGCKARIKFTQKKNSEKFFSTWNKEGTLHEESCQYYVKYKGKLGREKLKAFYQDVEVDTEHIKDTIRRKIANLKKLNEQGDEKPNNLTTLGILESGGREVVVGIDGENAGEVSEKRIYIGSLDAELLDPSYVSTRKCVFGYINNVQIRESKSREKYAYLNLHNTRHNVSVYFPPAFYSTENNSLSKFEEFISVLESVIENGEKYQFIGVGFIEYKKKEGINIRILDKDHFVINELEYDLILGRRGV